MLILGLVGGIASGKSFVAECFRELGAAVLDGDKTGHAVLREPAIIDAILSFRFLGASAPTEGERP